MIEVFRFQISKDQLRKIPQDERNLLILAGHAINQISVLQKLLIFSLNYKSDHEIENTLSGAQSQTILRILFGALVEAWEMVKRPINQKLIGNEYINLIGDEGKSTYDELNKHFGKSNLLHKMRNSFSYHHPNGPTLDAAFESLSESENWAWYLSGRNNNSFYLSSDTIISAGIIGVTGTTDRAKAFEKVMDVTLHVTKIMPDFLQSLIVAIVTRHLGADSFSMNSKVTISNAPSLNKIAIPFFTEVGDEETPDYEF